MQFAKLVELIENTAPLSIAAPWDHSGVQVAAYRERIFRLAVCLDPLPRIIRQALDEGADMVLSHHPLVMQARFTDRLDAYHEVLSLLFKADVPLYAAHTSLDANPLGPATWLGRELGLRPFADDRKDASLFQILEITGYILRKDVEIPCGFGVVGDLPMPLTPEQLHLALAPWLAGSVARCAGTLPQQIRRVAICPGSGASLAAAAAQYGADILISGDLKYHTALETPLPVLDVGHFSLEAEMMRRFAGELESVLPDVSVFFVPGCDPLQPFSFFAK